MIKRLFFCVFSVMLGIALIRSFQGYQPLRFEPFMKALSSLDIDFNFMFGQWQNVIEAFYALRSSNGLTVVWRLITLLKDIILLPVSLVVDLLAFIQSVYVFVILLLQSA